MRAGLLGPAARALLADPGTLTARAAGGDGYTLTEHLLMLVLDELRVANWQRSKDGQKGTNRPTRVSPLANPQRRRPRAAGRLTPEQKAAYLARIGPRAA